ncbi:MAG: hypothetical protein P4M00_04550 [Azospirillaceae bacterium]|nr:hypothetical protein [Azospirillaceae bacterium]
MFSYARAKDLGKQKIKRLIADMGGHRIRELPTAAVTLIEPGEGPRLNLMILGIRKEAVFGGADTALRFFRKMQPHYSRARILVLREDERDFDSAAWPGWELESRGGHGRQTIAFLRQPGFRPGVEPEDQFIATHWLTATYVRAIRDLQAAQGKGPQRPFIYLIQDFEPGFYPWSGRYLLASSSYANPHEVIAVFNTALLREYFQQSGYYFPASHVFEPSLNPALTAFRGQLAGHRKRRLLLVYGRPATPRNAFDLVVECLLVWSMQYGDAAQWEILSLGERHRDIPLAKGLVLRSGGKVSLEQYAGYLLDAAVGISLMVSPHPSYPPLEMAEFGIRVVTNGFANKDLSTRSPMINSLIDTTPKALAAALIESCDAFRDTPFVADMPSAFLGNDDEFPFLSGLAHDLLNS